MESIKRIVSGQLPLSSSQILNLTDSEIQSIWEQIHNRPSSSHKIKPLGNRQGDTRVIGADDVGTTTKNRAIICNNGVADPDGLFDSSAQGYRGDCYLLAEINAIRNSKDGQAILKKNVKTNFDGSITVTLPGAIAIRQAYKSKGYASQCEITGTYLITADAVKKAKTLAGDAYSKNDIEVIALEIAMEIYRSELQATKNNLGIGTKVGGIPDSPEDAAGIVKISPESKADYLSGGFMHDAGFILTGQKADIYSIKNYNNSELYFDGKYGYININELNNSQFYIDKKFSEPGSGISEINSLTDSEKELNNMLNKCMGHESEYAITCGVRVGKNGPDGSTKVLGGHALTVVKITADTVYVSNPWHPDKVEPVPRKDFIKMCTNLSVQEMNEAAVSDNYTNVSLLDFANGILITPHKPEPHTNISDISALINIISNKNPKIKIPDNWKISNVRIREMLSKLGLSQNDFSELLSSISVSQLSQEDVSKVERLYQTLALESSSELSESDLQNIKELLEKFVE